MNEQKFRAVINEKITIHFTLLSLINPLFSIRNFVIPWLEAGGIPDRCIEKKDKNGKEIYEGDKFLINIGKGVQAIDTIVFEYPSWKGQPVDGSRYTLFKYMISDTEIIGNIHEGESNEH